MSVNIEHLETEVVAEGQPPAPRGEAAESWEELDRLRQLQHLLQKDLQRLAAEGYDD